MGKGLLIIVLGFSTIFSGMMFNITAKQQLSSQAIVKQYEKWLTQNAVESASNVAVSKLYQDFDWRTGYSSQSFAGTSYSVTVADITSDSTMEAKKLRVKAVATYSARSDSTIVVVMRPAYSYFYYFVHNWPNFITYNTGDTLLGPIHANDRIRISNSPVFLDKVSSDDSTYESVSSPAPKFYADTEFGTQTISTPDLVPLTDSTAAGGDVFSEELWLTFKSDGSYDFATSGGASGNRSISSINGTIMTTSNKDIHVKGIVNGAVTILGDHNLFIENDLVYASNPLTNPDSDDYLGLIARHDVVIPDSGISNIDIHGAIIALHDFKVENFDSGAPRGTLTIVGSLILDDDSESGTFSGGVLEHGFKRIHSYDPRLRQKTSPFFPRLDRVEVLFRGY